jgi:methylase of polypeptide subunit release factors
VLSDLACQRLASALAEQDYTVDAVLDLIGPEANRALGRNITVPAVRAITGRSDPLAVLTSIWVLQRPVSRRAFDRALPGLINDLVGAAILEESAGEVSAAVDIRPYASDDGVSGWVVSDLVPNLDTKITPVRPDFVLGASSASAALAQLAIRRPVGRALDLGTGSGVQCLHLVKHADSVVATDLNPRAIDMAALTMKINSIEVDLRRGDLFAPVTHESFDLIISNPSYVIAPPQVAGKRLTYRETDHRGDGLIEHLVRAGAARLVSGGVLQLLANWVHVAGSDWSDRLRDWIAATGCDAHVVQRETLDPSEYVELWLADAGLAGSPDYVDRYDQWLDYLQRTNVEAVGLGWIVLRRSERIEPELRIENWPYQVEQPIGAAFEHAFHAIDLARSSDPELLDHAWRLSPDVVEETRGVPGAADPASIVFRQQHGFRRALQADTALAAILGACDGDLDLGTIITTVAGILGLGVDALTDSVLTSVRQCIQDGFLV